MPGAAARRSSAQKLFSHHWSRITPRSPGPTDARHVDRLEFTRPTGAKSSSGSGFSTSRRIYSTSSRSHRSPPHRPRTKHHHARIRLLRPSNRRRDHQTRFSMPAISTTFASRTSRRSTCPICLMRPADSDENQPTKRSLTLTLTLDRLISHDATPTR